MIVADNNVSCGNYIMAISSIPLYALSQLLVSKRDEVSQGREIGLAGSAGSSTGLHLYFAVTVNDEYKNPLNDVSY